MAVLVPEEPEAPLMVRDAVPLTVTVLLADPEVRGAKVIVKAVLCPAPKVAGNTSPLIVNAELPMDACVTVTLVPPGFFRVADFAMLWPTATVPKERDVGLTCMLPAATALPRSATRAAPV